MMMGLVPSTPDRMPNSWQYGLDGLDALDALGLDLPPVGICKDSAGNVIDCGQAGAGACDPTYVSMGYSCYVDVTGAVTYVGPGGQAPPPIAGPPAAPGTGSQGSSTGAGSGASGAPGGPPAPPKSNWQTWLLAAGVLVLAAKAMS